MVKEAARAAGRFATLVAEQPLWVRLAPEDRVRVLAALAALLILGFALIAFVWWAGRYTRRYMADPRREARDRAQGVPSEQDWARKPLFPDQPEAGEDE